jgi:hypothetical protein
MKENLITYHSDSKKQRDAKCSEILKNIPNRVIYCDAYVTNSFGTHKKWVGRLESINENRMKHQQRLFRDKYGIDMLFTKVSLINI